VIVVEADERSGALITARQACDDHGRPVFAVPGRVDNPLSQGPHQLIRDGAILCARVEDVLDNLGPLPAEAIEPSPAPAEATTLFDVKPQPSVPAISEASEKSASALPELPDRQQLIVEAIGLESMSVDLIVDQTGLPPHIVFQELTYLTLRGIVKRVDGQTYARRK
jgi:DNA processing protein